MANTNETGIEYLKCSRPDQKELGGDPPMDFILVIDKSINVFVLSSVDGVQVGDATMMSNDESFIRARTTNWEFAINRYSLGFAAFRCLSNTNCEPQFGEGKCEFIDKLPKKLL